MTDTYENGKKGRITVVTEANFDAEVKQQKGLVVLDFWAEWCGPCKMLAPVMEELSMEMQDVKFCKVNVDEEMQLAMNYRIASIPMLIVFRDGEIVGKSVGYEPKESVKEKIENLK